MPTGNATPARARVRRATGYIRLRERKRGGPAWYVKYRTPQGERKHGLLAPAWKGKGRPPEGHLTRQMAEAKLRELLVDLDRGGGHATPVEGRTFRQACDEWLRYVEHDRRRAASTIADYRRAVYKHLIPELGEETPLTEITTDVIDAYRERLLEEGRLTRRTIQKYLTILHGILKRAKRKKWIAENPAADAERVTVRRTGDFRVLSAEQVAAVARAAADGTWGALFTVAAFTGLRMGELRALRWRDVDFAKRIVHVRGSFVHGAFGTTKSGRVRSVPMSDDALRAFDLLSRRRDFVADDDLVFPSTVGTPLDDGDIRDEFYAALSRAELGHLREGERPIVFHDLRHTFGTLAVQAFPVTDVKAFMGHADIQTTMIYVHHVPQHDAAERLSRVMRADAPAEELLDQPERIAS